MLQSYQSAAFEGTSKAFLLEGKCSLFYKYESKIKLYKSNNLSILLYASNVCFLNRPNSKKKTRKKAKSSAQLGFEKKF